MPSGWSAIRRRCQRLQSNPEYALRDGVGCPGPLNCSRARLASALAIPNSLRVRDRIPHREGTAMETQPEVVEYFRSLEIALNEQKKKGTPKGDPRTAGYIPNSLGTLRK